MHMAAGTYRLRGVSLPHRSRAWAGTGTGAAARARTTVHHAQAARGAVAELDAVERERGGDAGRPGQVVDVGVVLAQAAVRVRVLRLLLPVEGRLRAAAGAPVSPGGRPSSQAPGLQGRL